MGSGRNIRRKRQYADQRDHATQEDEIARRLKDLDDASFGPWKRHAVVTRRSSPYTADEWEFVLVDPTQGAVVIVLPEPNEACVLVASVADSANLITVKPGRKGVRINGQTSFQLGPRGAILLYPTKNQWIAPTSISFVALPPSIFGTPVDVGSGNVDGSAATIPRSDHVHKTPSLAVVLEFGGNETGGADVRFTALDAANFLGEVLIERAGVPTLYTESSILRSALPIARGSTPATSGGFRDRKSGGGYYSTITGDTSVGVAYVSGADFLVYGEDVTGVAGMLFILPSGVDFEWRQGVATRWARLHTQSSSPIFSFGSATPGTPAYLGVDAAAASNDGKDLEVFAGPAGTTNQDGGDLLVRGGDHEGTGERGWDYSLGHSTNGHRTQLGYRGSGTGDGWRQVKRYSTSVLCEQNGGEETLFTFVHTGNENDSTILIPAECSALCEMKLLLIGDDETDAGGRFSWIVRNNAGTAVDADGGGTLNLKYDADESDTIAAVVNLNEVGNTVTVTISDGGANVKDVRAFAWLDVHIGEFSI